MVTVLGAAIRFGRVDILVNNAAVLLSENSDVLSISSDDYTRTFDTNVLGAIEVCRAFAGHGTPARRTRRQRFVWRGAARDHDHVRTRLFDL